jgi:hypothetical protein
MYFYIIIALMGYVVFKNRHNISTGLTFYQSLKKMIDPDGTKGHFHTISSMWNIFQAKTKVEAPVEKFNRDYIKISYTYKNKSYFYLLKVQRGVTPLTSIIDEQGNDVTDVIVPYLGPNLDCHGQTLTPKDFGYQRLTVTTVLDSVCFFGENDRIIF